MFVRGKSLKQGWLYNSEKQFNMEVASCFDFINMYGTCFNFILEKYSWIYLVLIKSLQHILVRWFYLLLGPSLSSKDLFQMLG